MRAGDKLTREEPMEQARKGTRCAVCVMCGKCFEDDAADSVAAKWRGERCEVCVGCGKCAEAWGLVGGDEDATSGPTNWADAFRAMDDGNRMPPPPVSGAPGVA